MSIRKLRKELMEQYPYMKCGNVLEFNQRLQWLSEGMLKNQLSSVISYTIDQDEIKLYQEFCEKRLTLKNKPV
jgi:hypothetical protein